MKLGALINKQWNKKPEKQLKKRGGTSLKRRGGAKEAKSVKRNQMQRRSNQWTCPVCGEWTQRQSKLKWSSNCDPVQSADSEHRNKKDIGDCSPNKTTKTNKGSKKQVKWLPNQFVKSAKSTGAPAQSADRHTSTKQQSWSLSKFAKSVRCTSAPAQSADRHTSIKQNCWSLSSERQNRRNLITHKRSRLT